MKHILTQTPNQQITIKAQEGLIWAIQSWMKAFGCENTSMAIRTLLMEALEPYQDIIELTDSDGVLLGSK